MIEALSCNHCCSEKAIGITYSECEFAALGIQHAIRMGHIIIRRLARSKIFFHIMSLTTRFSGKKIY